MARACASVSALGQLCAEMHSRTVPTQATLSSLSTPFVPHRPLCSHEPSSEQTRTRRQIQRSPDSATSNSIPLIQISPIRAAVPFHPTLSSSLIRTKTGSRSTLLCVSDIRPRHLASHLGPARESISCWRAQTSSFGQREDAASSSTLATARVKHIRSLPAP